MAITDDNTIQLSVSDKSKYLEGGGADVITPGNLLELTSSGEYIKHATPGGETASIFATENIYNGGTVDDVYTVGQRVMARHCRSGDRVLAWLLASEDVSVGTFLSSGGNGVLKIAGLGENPVAVVYEDVPTETYTQRIKVETTL